MMKYIHVVTLVVFALPLFAQEWVVVGEDFLLFQNENKPEVLVNGVRSKSWALDSSSCRLWLTDESGKRLRSFVHGVESESQAFEGRIVSDVEKHHFFTKTDLGEIQLRSSSGSILSTIEAKNSQFITKIREGASGELWTLNQGKIDTQRDSFWLSQINSVTGTNKNIFIESDIDLWGTTDLVLDDKLGHLWVGYSSATPKHTYSPRVKLFSKDGILKSNYKWEERGLFFGGCLEKSGGFLMARDIPTMPYTVPVYSFLERLIPNNSPKPVMELNLNLLVDSLFCDSENVFMAVHSILGGQERQILRSSKDLSNPPEVIKVLPGRAQKLWVCGGRKS